MNDQAILDALPKGSMLGRPPKGYCHRKRDAVLGLALDEVDAAVERAGGYKAFADLQSKGLRPGRTVAPPSQRVWWYAIPRGALSEPE